MERTEGIGVQVIVTRVVNGWVIDRPVSEGVVETRVVESSDTDHLVEALEELFRVLPELEEDEEEEPRVPSPPKKKKRGKKQRAAASEEDEEEDL